MSTVERIICHPLHFQSVLARDLVVPGLTAIVIALPVSADGSEGECSESQRARRTGPEHSC